MRKGDFHKIVGIKGISDYFDTSRDFVSKLANAPDQSLFYEEMHIPKKNRKRQHQSRTVFKARPDVSQLQKNIATSLSSTVNFPDCVQGFIKDRATSSNARQHLGRKILVNADIKDFFDSITIDRVESAFLRLGFETETAKLLSKICTLNGILRQGLHTSPIISNLVTQDMDADLLELCRQHSAVYTRYADDISISSDDSVPTKTELEAVLGKHQFVLNQNKHRVSARGQAQYVTGLSVFDANRPRVPKRFKRRLRLELYFIKKYGFADHLDHNKIESSRAEFKYKQLKGRIDYVNAVEPDLAERLCSYCPDLFAK